jgi:hypothetical protein
VIANNPFWENVWKFFTENTLGENTYNGLRPDIYKSIGYIKCDRFLNYAPDRDYPNQWRLPRDKSFRIVWKPRWVATLGHSNLLTYAFYFVNLLEHHPEIDFIFYIHPGLERTIVDKGIATRKAQRKLFDRFNNLPNARVSDDGDFLEYVMTADLFIGDVCSTISEFLLTKKPVIYTPVEVDFNDYGRKLAEGMYIVNNQTEMHTTIMNIMKGFDPLSAKRRDIPSVISEPLPGKTMAKGLCKYLKDQFLDLDSEYNILRKNLQNKIAAETKRLLFPNLMQRLMLLLASPILKWSLPREWYALFRKAPDDFFIATAWYPIKWLRKALRSFGPPPPKRADVNHLQENIDYLLTKHGRLAFWGVGNYFRLHVPSWLSDRPGIFLVDRVNRDSFGQKQGQSSEILKSEKVDLIIISAAPNSASYWAISRNAASEYPKALALPLEYLLWHKP